MNFFKWLRKRALSHGYACDMCGAELFDYPLHRLCASCEDKLVVAERPCPKCGRERVSGGLCMDCKYTVPFFTQGISAFVYKGEGGALVNRMKNGYPRLAAYLGEKMAERFLAQVKPWEGILLIVAIPMTKAKERERGYNQAERLAESVYEYLTARGVSAELNFSLLEKTRDTKEQKHGSVAERVENVRGAFHLRSRKAFEGKTVLIVDDIMTTGSTGSACAEKILRAGASKAYFLTAMAVAENK